jgi:hypothetical protein
MRKFAILLSFCLFANAEAASRVEPFQNENYQPVNLKIDNDALNQIWEYVKQETGADSDFPAPKMFVYNNDLPRKAIMAFSYPTAGLDGTLGVFVPTSTIRTMGRDEPQRFLWSIGHEFTHYTMFLRKNNWNTNKRQYPENRDQHCDQEFQRITRGIADLLYQKYQSESAKRVMYNEVDRACRVAPEQ